MPIPANISKLLKKLPTLNEKDRRLLVAKAAKRIGHGGVVTMSRITGMSPHTIRRGLEQLQNPHLIPSGIRKPGSGRNKVITESIAAEIEQLMQVSGSLRFTEMSAKEIAAYVRKKGGSACPTTVAAYLSSNGYLVQGARNKPEIKEQFTILGEIAEPFFRSNDPVVSVSIGIEAELAVESICQWWQKTGKHQYPRAERMLVCAISGDGTSFRSRIWRRRLQALADTEWLPVTVCRMPYGTHKWENRTVIHIQLMRSISAIMTPTVQLSEVSLIASGEWNYTIFPRGIRSQRKGT